MQITILQAILLGLFCFLVSTGMFPLGWLSMNIMSKPLIHCLIIGMIMGDMNNAADDHRLRYSGGLYRSDVDRRGRDLAQNQYRALVCFAADVGFGR